MKAALLALAVWLQAPLAQAQHVDLPKATNEHGGFAFSDLSGVHLLMRTEISRPELLRNARCAGGGSFQIRVDGRQEEKGHNGRETAWNFDKLGGQVFSVLKGRIEEDAPCFLASDVLLDDYATLPVTPPAGAGGCVQRRRYASLRDRKVVHCWPLARLGPGRELALVEFERRGRNALASLVLTDRGRIVFADYAAEAESDSGDVWRVDDGGRLSPEGFEIVCALQAGTQYALGIAWIGSEGANLSFWISDGERFVKTVVDYWYHAPL